MPRPALWQHPDPFGLSTLSTDTVELSKLPQCLPQSGLDHRPGSLSSWLTHPTPHPHPPQLLLVASASALVAKAPASTRFQTRVASAAVEPESSYVPPPPAPVKAIAAKWFPFGLKAPLLLDGTLAGDAGFDPLGLGSSSTKSLYWMADAEVKHARLAMLAAVGW